MYRNIVLDVLFIVEVFENKYYYIIIILKSTSLCQKCITSESSNISRIVLSCVSAFTCTHIHLSFTRTHTHLELACTRIYLHSLTRTLSRAFTHMHSIVIMCTHMHSLAHTCTHMHSLVLMYIQSHKLCPLMRFLEQRRDGCRSQESREVSRWLLSTTCLLPTLVVPRTFRN